jgi:hypothetical protein
MTYDEKRPNCVQLQRSTCDCQNVANPSQMTKVGDDHSIVDRSQATVEFLHDGGQFVELFGQHLVWKRQGREKTITDIPEWRQAFSASKIVAIS